MVSSARRSRIIVAVLWPSQEFAEHARLLAVGVATVVGKPVNSNTLLQKLSAVFEKTDDAIDGDYAAD